MQNKTDLKDKCIDRLENSISDEHFRYYEYSDFKNIQTIGKGSFGNVVRVNWKDADLFFALKSFKNDIVSMNEVVNEVQSLYLFNRLLKRLKSIHFKYFIDKVT